jgi:hypothetical protein
MRSLPKTYASGCVVRRRRLSIARFMESVDYYFVQVLNSQAAAHAVTIRIADADTHGQRLKDPGEGSHTSPWLTRRAGSKTGEGIAAALLTGLPTTDGQKVQEWAAKSSALYCLGMQLGENGSLIFAIRHFRGQALLRT